MNRFISTAANQLYRIERVAGSPQSNETDSFFISIRKINRNRIFMQTPNHA